MFNSSTSTASELTYLSLVLKTATNYFHLSKFRISLSIALTAALADFTDPAHN